MKLSDERLGEILDQLQRGATRLNRDPGRMAEHYLRTESIAPAHLGTKPIGCGSKDFAWIPLIRRRNPTAHVGRRRTEPPATYS